MLQAGSEPCAEGRFHVLIREPVLPAPVAVRIAELSIDPSLGLLANLFGCLRCGRVHVFLSGWERGSGGGQKLLLDFERAEAAFHENRLGVDLENLADA